MLTHAHLWRAIDRLAEKHGLSPSGLARKAGLSATLFNPSKRSLGHRNRWPSTESIAAILEATGASFEEFVALTSTNSTQHIRLPLSGVAEAAREGAFDEEGLPNREMWDAMPLPCAQDPNAFALEITGRNFEPVYKEGDRIILSPAEKPRRGDKVALLTVQGEIMIKRLGREGAQKLDLLELHPDDQPTTLLRKDVAWVYRIVWANQ